MINDSVSGEEVLTQIGRELQNKIARIRSCNQTLTAFFESTAGEDHKKYFSTIEQDCSDLKSIIHNLIDLDRCYEENPNLKPSPTHLNRFLSDLVNDYDLESIHKKRVKLHFEDIDEAIHIIIDPQAIQRAFSYILSNAIKFSHPDGEVVIKVIRYANVANISVADQGIGIPKKLRPYLFSKFTKAARRGTNGEESAGLGLYLTKNIIEKHQGSIWLESEEGVGTNVFINLPIRDRL
ncbi:MAG: HAMP domain-containing sensor histidine kinase [Tunicatimonas sp.]|uniref:sensor histidine kinase n=1 Tax=Tunicatimonas sp. TaxID=1940096 RepID=UPI003C7408B2